MANELEQFGDVIGARIALRFVSGNSVPIERAYITAEEWATIVAALQQAQQPGAQAVAWKIPRIVTFANAQRTNCPPDMQAELEGCVAWELSMFGDAAPVIDKHGTLHRPIPLYTAPPPLPEGVSEDLLTIALEANDLCRSAHAVAERVATQYATVYAGTNFGALHVRLNESLERQHKVLALHRARLAAKGAKS